MAQGECDWFESTISRHVPADMPVLMLSQPTDGLDILTQAKPELSKSALKRLVEQGGVEWNERKIVQPSDLLDIATGDVLKIGKRNWFRVQRMD